MLPAPAAAAQCDDTVLGSRSAQGGLVWSCCHRQQQHSLTMRAACLPACLPSVKTKYLTSLCQDRNIKMLSWISDLPCQLSSCSCKCYSPHHSKVFGVSTPLAAQASL